MPGRNDAGVFFLGSRERRGRIPAARVDAEVRKGVSTPTECWPNTDTGGSFNPTWTSGGPNRSPGGVFPRGSCPLRRPTTVLPAREGLWWRATFGGLAVARWPRLRLPSRLRQPGMNHAVGGWLRAGSGSVGCHETYGGANTRAGADGRPRARVQAARTVACRPAGPRCTAWLARPRLRSRARAPAQCVQPVQADRHM